MRRAVTLLPEFASRASSVWGAARSAAAPAAFGASLLHSLLGVAGSSTAVVPMSPALSAAQQQLPAAPPGRRGFADDAAGSTLAPCERPPVEQSANELDAQLAAAAQQGAEAVLALVEQRGEQFTEQNVVTALEAVASTLSNGGGAAPTSADEVVRTDAYQALVDMMLAGLQRFPPGLLAQAVHACGVAGASEEMLLDEIGRHLMKHVEELRPADIVQLATGLAALDHSPGITLFESMAATAAAHKGEFTAEQRQAVSAAYAALGYSSKSPF